MSQELTPFDWDAWVIMGKPLDKVILMRCPDLDSFCLADGREIIDIQLSGNTVIVTFKYNQYTWTAPRTGKFPILSHDLCLKN